MGRVVKNQADTSRSRPVSCVFCRSRKLRCSRNFPCTNCVSRGLDCPHPSLPSAQTDRSAEILVPTQESASVEEDVLARLRRLEEIVIGHGVTPPIASTGSSMHAGTPPSHASPGSFARKFDHYKRSASSPSSHVDWLEGEISHPASTNCLVSYEIEFKTCSINIATSPSSFSNRGNTPIRCIWLPLHEESMHIVDKYLVDITHLHHVVHAPSVRSLVRDIYYCLNQKSDPRLGDACLLSAMITSTLFFWTERDTPEPLFTSAEAAYEKTSLWLQRTLDLLDLSRRIGSGTIEEVQATIIVGFVICNMVGISSQAHFWFSSATSIAWQLSLHRIDHPQNGDLNVPRPDSVKAEVARRVWWNLVGTDWQFSQYAGAQRGMYMINPRHMATRKPINSNDEDLVDGMEGVGQPIDQPTSMSYCLQRFRLAELCRELTDSEPFPNTGQGPTNYQRIRDIDARMIEFIDNLPPFFSLDFEVDQLPDSDPRRSTPITVQRYILNCLVNAQRCRIHLPYLTKIAKDSKYLYSRTACLEAARMVIRTERQLRTENLPFVLMRLKSSGILHCVCMGIIVLLMDVCLNRNFQTGDEREIRMEIFSAFSILEEAKGQSPFAERILGSFYRVLQRYNIQFVPPEKNPLPRPEDSAEIDQSSVPAAQNVPMILPDQEAIFEVEDPILPSFNDFFDEFSANVDPGNLDWDALFPGLESAFVSM
ncbi:hypothetical protein N7481_007644 [Penicillium waksmanii]|uniref:uncharacterized protein n=1 Tax=Penicillium waksmanii TaxID=69791 RepID=UPI0025466831|nr:uncharacterized protein N7481_007644 [Penicillium waksmanii]KAJ5980346.1 hypothetical protein N7481_007644 [Penicillium waksmanii]